MTAATIYMSLVGAEGLERVAAACHANTRALADKLRTVPGVVPLFNRPVFHETAVHLPAAAKPVLDRLATQNILGGYSLDDDYPELGNALLVCATEVHADEDLSAFVTALRAALGQQ